MLVPSSSSEVYPSAPLFRSILRVVIIGIAHAAGRNRARARVAAHDRHVLIGGPAERAMVEDDVVDVVASVLLVEDLDAVDRKSTRLNSSHVKISYAVFCL